MVYSLLNQINPTKDDWAIQIRLVRMWEAVNTKANNALLGLELLLADSTGGTVQAFVRKNLTRKFKPLLQEGHVYVIRNFKVKLTKMEYKVVPCDQRIYFDQDTQVVVNNQPVQIPIHVFSFVPPETHRQRLNNNHLLTDIIGCVVGAGEVEFLDAERKRMKRSIELASAREEGSIYKITLWGGICPIFDSSAYTDAATPVIAVITSTTVKRFTGQLSYSTTTASRIYFNPAIPEAVLLKSRFGGEPHHVRVLKKEQRTIVPLAEQMVLNRRSIQEILEMTRVSSTQECLFTVLATVVGVDNSHGWTYVSCPCKKKIEPTNGTFFCTDCNKECEYPVIRYKIHLQVVDAAGTATTFVLFDEEAHKLLGQKATTYVTQMGIGSTQLPADMNRLIGKTYVFKLRLTDYNLVDGREDYTVSKIFKTDTGVDQQLPTLPVSQVAIDGKNKGLQMDTGADMAANFQASNASSSMEKKTDDMNNVKPVDTPVKQEHKKPRIE